MTAKEYLNQAFRIDQRINSKLEQIESLRTLLTKTSSTLSDMPKNPNKSNSRTEDLIIKIMMIEDEIKADIDKLVSLKKEVSDVINAVEPVECRMLLELRYLCFHKWEDIAAEMNYTVRNVHLLHSKALGLVHVPEK